jgi:hypothetical protein
MKKINNVNLSLDNTMNQNRFVMPFEYIIILIYLGMLIFNGFITNLIPIGGLPNTGSLIIDIFILISYYIFLIIFIENIIIDKSISKKWFSVNLLYIFFAMLCLIPVAIGNGPLVERILGYRNIVIYMGPFFVISLLRVTKKTIQSMLNILLFLSLILTIFGIIQSMVGTSLPPILLLIRRQSDVVFSFFQTDVVRSNGLLGNTIIYAGFLCFIFSIYVARFLVKRSKYDLVAIGIIVIANILTYSRASFVSFFLIFLTNYLIIKGVSFKNMFFGGLIVVVVGIAIIGYQSQSGNSLLMERLKNEERSTQGSTAVHLLQTFNAIENIIAHPIMGVGIGSQGSSSRGKNIIIYDGFWFQLVLEVGIPLALLYFIIYFYSIYIAVVTAKRSIDPLNKILGAGFVGGGVSYFVMSFINSALFSPVTYVLFWTVFGLLLSLNRLDHSIEATS